MSRQHHKACLNEEFKYRTKQNGNHNTRAQDASAVSQVRNPIEPFLGIYCIFFMTFINLYSSLFRPKLQHRLVMILEDLSESLVFFHVLTESHAAEPATERHCCCSAVIGCQRGPGAAHRHRDALRLCRPKPVDPAGQMPWSGRFPRIRLPWKHLANFWIFYEFL